MMPEGTIDLRTGNTVWQVLHGEPKAYLPLLNDVECEVVVIGGGITGALISYHLIEAGVDCVLIDQQAIGGGSTSASTALLLYELDTPLIELTKQIGESDAAACYRVCLDSIEKIGHLAEMMGGCDYQPRLSFYLAEADRDVAQMASECTLRRRHGMAVELFRREEIEERFSFTRPAALVSHDAAEIDIVAFVDALLQRSREGGLRTYGDTQMTGLRETPGGVCLHTQEGCEISACKAVFATGYESERYLRRKRGMLKSTYAIATRPIDEFRGWYRRSLIWTTARPYLYLRTTRDRRAIIGGGDVDFYDEAARDSLLPSKAMELELALHSMFPEMEFALAGAWAGTFGETPDSLARIGETDEMPGAYFALGYGGNGVAYSAIAAEIIRDAYLGKANSSAPLFRLDR